MNTEKKVSILKEMRKHIESGCKCLCGALNKAMDYSKNGITLDDLGIVRPDNAGGVYWFPCYDKEPRLKLIDEALAKCETTFKVGDRVRVTKKVGGLSYPMWVSEMDGCIGREYEIKGIDENGNPELPVKSYGWFFPKDSVELITETDPIKEAEQRVKDAQAELERLKNTPKDVEGLYKGQIMYWLCSEDIERQDLYTEGSYLSKERAEKELLRIRLAFIADSLNGGLFEPKNGEVRFTLSYNQLRKAFDVESWVSTCRGDILFKTRELAEQAMTYFTKDELIKMLS
ncbi:hypothetical protein [Flavobacterium filum]|uniref:hypothetical protein n=1 Tax=Flavobacterium filum TaxID=370974 RepID=UPI0023F28F35|nr:hypothetical protein [Flavobacterium filum]